MKLQNYGKRVILASKKGKIVTLNFLFQLFFVPLRPEIYNLKIMKAIKIVFMSLVATILVSCGTTSTVPIWRIEQHLNLFAVDEPHLHNAFAKASVAEHFHDNTFFTRL